MAEGTAGGTLSRRASGTQIAAPFLTFESPRMSNRTLWVVIGIVVIVILLVFGFLPLPGQKDNITPHSEPAAPAAR